MTVIKMDVVRNKTGSRLLLEVFWLMGMIITNILRLLNWYSGDSNIGHPIKILLECLTFATPVIGGSL